MEKSTEFNVESADVSILGESQSFSYDVLIKALDGVNFCDSYTIKIEIQNPCYSTSLVVPTINNQTVFLDAVDPIIIDEKFTDQVSLLKGSQDGLTFCGARSYEFSEPEMITA